MRFVLRRLVASPASVLVLCFLCAAVGEAAAGDYPWFSLELPQGWQAGSPVVAAGTWTLPLTGPGQNVHVRIMVGKTAGPPDAADVAGLLRMAAGVGEPLRRREGQYAFRGRDASGTDTACVVGADPKAALYMAVLCSGAADAAEPLLAALRSERHAAMLPRGQATSVSTELRFLLPLPSCR